MATAVCLRRTCTVQLQIQAHCTIGRSFHRTAGVGLGLGQSPRTFDWSMQYGDHTNRDKIHGYQTVTGTGTAQVPKNALSLTVRLVRRTFAFGFGE